MTSKVRIWIHVPLAFALFSCAHGADSSGGRHGGGMAESKADRATRADDIFTLFDADGDGYLTKSELERGLRSASNVEPNPNLMMAMDKAPKKKKAKTARALTDAQVKRAIAQAFKDDKGLEEKISREEFRKVVAERPAGTESEDPWAPFM